VTCGLIVLIAAIAFVAVAAVYAKREKIGDDDL
jgi:hypothetical protein